MISFINIPVLVAAGLGAVSAHPGTSVNSALFGVRAVPPTQCDASIPPVDISGEYVLTKYGAGANDWHFVTVAGSASKYQWTNRADVSWTLTRDGANKELFAVGKECPYYADGYTKAVVEARMAPGGVKQATAIYGPFDEVYTLKSLVDPWNPVFCPFGDVDTTCWADTAYQKCASDQQGAYDTIMAEKAGGQEAMYYKYLCVTATC
ncbi:hypothetical protein GQ53DRAFT_774726 [Thozetella sp. PMI_491]|nr:hypothetical protein GQ53DRAFT_774726 [Thozetella sp. PMI_491]